MTREEAIKELRGFIGQLTEGCQEAIKGNLEEIPSNVDLEKAAGDYQLKTRGRLNVMGGDAVLSKEEYMKFNSNKDFKAGAEWAFKQFSDILDKWEEHAIKGMRLGASAYHQGKIALICDLRDWIKEQTQKQ